MDEKELIGKICLLRQIKPRKDWVVLTKKRIIEEPSPKRLVSFWEVLRFNLRPAYVLPVILLTVLVAGAFIYFSVQPGEGISPQLGSTSDISQIEALNPTLQQLQANINQTKETLEKSRLSPKSALALGESVKATTESGKSFISQIKSITEAEGTSTEVLASMGELEKSLEELEASYQIKLEGVVALTVADLEELTLSPEQEELFNQAKEDYQNGDCSEALIKILQL